MTTRVTNVAVTTPPTIGAAIRRIVSELALVIAVAAEGLDAFFGDPGKH